MASTWSILAFFGAAYFQLVGATTSQFTCPNAAGTVLTDDAGVSYMIYCGSDTTPGSPGVGSNQAVTSGGTFRDCITTCDNTAGCTAVTYSGETNGVGTGTCYFKSGYPSIATGGNTGLVTLVNYQTGQFYGPTYTCPANDKSQVTDQFGVSYILNCGGSMNTGNYFVASTSYGFDDCFQQCSNHSMNPTAQGPGYCDGFTYVGQPNGAGGGSCQLFAANQLATGSASTSTLVNAINAAFYSGPTPTTTISSVKRYVNPAATSATSVSVNVPVVTQIITATATTIVPLLPAVTYTVTYTTR